MEGEGGAGAGAGGEDATSPTGPAAAPAAIAAEMGIPLRVVFDHGHVREPEDPEATACDEQEYPEQGDGAP